MTRVEWDAIGERRFQGGLDRGMLYPLNTPGVPWNGLTGFSEKPIGGSSTPYYVDGIKYMTDRSLEEMSGTIEAFTYPDEFEACDGTGDNGHGLYVTGQSRTGFGLSYRTRIGNDIEGSKYGYLIHLVYNCMAEPSAKEHKTFAGTEDPNTLSWDVSTTPLAIPGFLPSPHIYLKSTEISPAKLDYLESILYGSSQTEPRMLTPSELSRMTSDLKFYQIIPNEVSGRSNLVESNTPDVMGYPSEGIYQATANTRLTPTSNPGLYTLDE